MSGEISTLAAGFNTVSASPPPVSASAPSAPGSPSAAPAAPVSPRSGGSDAGIVSATCHTETRAGWSLGATAGNPGYARRERAAARHAARRPRTRERPALA